MIDSTVQKFTSLRGDEFTLAVPEPTGEESYYFFALHKSGSVLFYNLLGDLAKAAGRAEMQLEPELFQQGVGLGDCPLDAALLLERPGTWFQGFRNLWLLPYIRRFRQSQKFMLVRDPRDIYVSYYFSVVKSHSVPEKGNVRDNVLEQRRQAESLSVDDFVRQGKADFIMNNMRAFRNLANHYDCKVYRYEDHIFNKADWLRDIASSCGVSVSDDVITEIASRYDIMPDDEQPDQHIRQVKPGNYRRHLSDESIELIERKFANLFDFFGYEREKFLEKANAGKSVNS